MKKNRQPDGSNTRDGRAIARRDFLANAALVGAGLAIRPLLRREGAGEAVAVAATRGSPGDASMLRERVRGKARSWRMRRRKAWPGGGPPRRPCRMV